MKEWEEWEEWEEWIIKELRIINEGIDQCINIIKEEANGWRNEGMKEWICICVQEKRKRSKAKEGFDFIIIFIFIFILYYCYWTDSIDNQYPYWLLTAK